jgi:hypothetical protein
MSKGKKGTKRTRRPTGKATFDERGVENINKLKEAISEYKTKDAIERAKEYGIDLTLLYENLSRTPTERIENFLGWLEFADELRRAKKRKDEMKC